MSTLVVESDTIDDLLRDVLPRILEDGHPISPTKGDAVEVTGAVLELSNPRARLSRTESRGKPLSCLGELCWYLSRTSEAEQIVYYIRAYENFADDGMIHGGYGPRLFDWRGIDQIRAALEILKSTDSRRAVIQLYDSEDTLSGMKDIPCTCTLQFLARAGELNMVTYMRSNDAVIGLPHDIFCFTMLQELVARSLGLELGTYKHMVGSLHVYHKNRHLADRFIAEGFQSTVPMPPMPLGDPWGNVDKLLEAEYRFRSRGVSGLGDWQELPAYWLDLVRLLAVLRLHRDRDLEQLTKLHRDVSPVYQSFVAARMIALGNTGD